jgi:hypothetical protein
MSSAVAVLLVISVAGLAVGDEGYHADLTAKIAAAKTAKDHEGIAAEYAKQAAEAKEEAARHDKMGASYTGAAREKLHLEEHCRAIADGYRRTAKEFEQMAEAHRTLAKEAGK